MATAEFGRWAKVPLLVGSTSDECDMWLGNVKPGIAETVAVASRERVRWFAGEDWPVLEGLFPAADYGGSLPATSRMMTVLEFNTSARYAAGCAASQHIPAYLDHFSRSRPDSPSGARHSAEVPYVFASVGAERIGSAGAGGRASVRGRIPLLGHIRGDRRPECRTALPAWPRYDPSRDALLRLDVPIVVAPAPFVAACEIAEQADQHH